MSLRDRLLENDLIGEEMNATYIMGQTSLLRSTMLFDEISKPRWHWYRSNWRVLHIDGFETGFGFRLVRYQFVQHALPPRENKTFRSIV